MLKEYRANCENELKSLVEKSNQKELSVMRSDSKNFMELAKYVLKQDDTVLFSGNFEEMKEFIMQGM